MSLRSHRPWAVDPDGEFPANVPEMLFIMAYQVARRQETRNDKLLKPLGLTATQWRVMIAIWRMGGGTMNELAARSAIDRTTLTRIVDQLVTAGRVMRTTPPEDRRQVRLSLTDEGERLMDEGWALISPVQQDVFAGLEAEEARKAIRLMQRMVVKMTEHPESLMAALGIAPAEPEEG